MLISPRMGLIGSSPELNFTGGFTAHNLHHREGQRVPVRLDVLPKSLAEDLYRSILTKLDRVITDPEWGLLSAEEKITCLWTVSIEDIQWSLDYYKECDRVMLVLQHYAGTKAHAPIYAKHEFARKLLATQHGIVMFRRSNRRIMPVPVLPS